MKRILTITLALASSLLFAGCKTASNSKVDRCAYYSAAYEAYKVSAVERTPSKDEVAIAKTAAAFLQAFCGWSVPRSQHLPDTDKYGVPWIMAPDDSAPDQYPDPDEQGQQSLRALPVETRAGPTPIGPPQSGRQISVPLGWDHNPLLDGTTEYRLYWSRTTNAWDGVVSMPASAGQRYTWTTPTPGMARFAVTAARPPIAAIGEKEYQESDSSNELNLQLVGPPTPPGRLQRN